MLRYPGGYRSNSLEDKLRVLSFSKRPTNQGCTTGLVATSHIELRLSIHIVDTKAHVSCKLDCSWSCLSYLPERAVAHMNNLPADAAVERLAKLHLD
jgi:hypothetical protein